MRNLAQIAFALCITLCPQSCSTLQKRRLLKRGEV
jgi:hypothetical protein